MERDTCKEHTGVVSRLATCEHLTEKLWGEIKSMQKMTLGIMVALSMNLVGVIFILILQMIK